MQHRMSSNEEQQQKEKKRKEKKKRERKRNITTEEETTPLSFSYYTISNITRKSIELHRNMYVYSSFLPCLPVLLLLHVSFSLSLAVSSSVLLLPSLSPSLSSVENNWFISCFKIQTMFSLSRSCPFRYTYAIAVSFCSIFSWQWLLSQPKRRKKNSFDLIQRKNVFSSRCYLQIHFINFKNRKCDHKKGSRMKIVELSTLHLVICFAF